MNKIISILTKGNSIIFVLRTDGDSDLWWWEVSKEEVEQYKGTIVDFVNDEDNATSGTSCGSFYTYEDVLEDIGDGWEDEWEDMECVLMESIESTDNLEELGKLITKADAFGYYGLGDMAFEKINNIKQANGIED